jgi:hypothetical protein
MRDMFGHALFAEPGFSTKEEASFTVNTEEILPPKHVT